MIKINRASRPDILTRVRRPRTSTAWNDPSVREVLHEMQREKCCYCEESELPVKGAGAAVEHFWPKATYKDKTNTWENLLLICDPCNVNKQDFPLDANNSPILIDPSDSATDPEIHFKYNFDLDDPLCGEISGKTKRGNVTVKTIKLFDFDYTKKRKDIVLNILSKLNDYLSAEGDLATGRPLAQQRLEAALAQIALLVDDASPYAGIARYIARKKGYLELIP